MTIFHVEKKQGQQGSKPEYTVVETQGLPPWGPNTEFAVVGTPYPRVEGKEKVTGRARYSYDIQLPGQLYAAVLRSPHPHARIASIDTSRAEALPGVHAVLSSANAPQIQWYQDSWLFDPILHFAGDEVAAVAAESIEIAHDALRLIQVEYEILPFVAGMEAALQPDAPNARESGPNTEKPDIYERGDVQAGMRAADVIIDQVYYTETALHNCLEPHGSTAFWEGDGLTLWDSTQSVFKVREQVADKLELPEHRVRVIKQYMGGGFGSKQIAWKNTVLAALLSRQAGRPVQLMLDREAENLAAGNRNATRQHVRIGAKRDGTITAMTVHINQQIGAYMVGGESSEVAGMYQTLYKCPNLRTEQVGIYTNTGPAVAFRAPGHVEGAFALESAMDELARALHMDPVDLRSKNYTTENQKKNQPYSSPDTLRLCYEKATAIFGWRDYRNNPQHGSKRRGIGFAAHDWSGGGNPPGYAWVKLNSDGSAEIITGTQDIGTGTRTGLAQVAAEELGLPLDRVVLHLGDTANGPYSPASAGSATQATIGPAVRAAAADAKRQLLEAAATVLEEEKHLLSISDGQIRVKGKPDKTTPVEKITEAITPHMIQGQGARGPEPEDLSVRTFGAQCVEVEVDIETGEITVLRVVAAHDCGRIINPKMVESQVIGAVTQGIGFGLSEERIIDQKTGIVLNANLEEYKVPTVADVPPIEYAQINVPDLYANSTGAKGIGEPPLVPTAPAIANAVFDATGIRIRHAPLTQQRILDALSHSGQGDQS